MTGLSRDERDHLRAALAAGRAADRLRPVAERGASDGPLVPIAVGTVEVFVPVAALRALVDLLEDLSEGREATVAPGDLAVGTAEAARLLGVSRTWIAELVDRGDLPGERVGSKRRVPLAALVAQRREQLARQRERARALGDAIDAGKPAPPAVTPEAAGLFVGGEVHVTEIPPTSEPEQELQRVEQRPLPSSEIAA
jgi:excisionase family DNA binding protein